MSGPLLNYLHGNNQVQKDHALSHSHKRFSRPWPGLTLRLEFLSGFMLPSAFSSLQDPWAQVAIQEHSQPITLCPREIYQTHPFPVTAEGALLLCP